MERTRRMWQVLFDNADREPYSTLVRDGHADFWKHVEEYVTWLHQSGEMRSCEVPENECPCVSMERAAPADEVITILEALRTAADELHLLAGDMNALRPGDPVGTPPLAEPKRGDGVDGAPRLAIWRILDG